MDRVLWRPDIDTGCHYLKIFLGYGTCPFASVRKLASSEFAYYMTQLGPKELIFFIRGNSSGGRHIMTQKVSPELACGSFPTPVKVSFFGLTDRHHPRNDNACFEIIIL